MPSEISLLLPNDVSREISPVSSFPSVHGRLNEYLGNYRRMDLTCKMPLNFREWILLILLIIVTIILALMALFQAIKRPPKCVPFYTNTTAGKLWAIQMIYAWWPIVMYFPLQYSLFIKQHPSEYSNEYKINYIRETHVVSCFYLRNFWKGSL
jgi:hypothetical protein